MTFLDYLNLHPFASGVYLGMIIIGLIAIANSIGRHW